MNNMDGGTMAGMLGGWLACLRAIAARWARSVCLCVCANAREQNRNGIESGGQINHEKNCSEYH